MKNDIENIDNAIAYLQKLREEKQAESKKPEPKKGDWVFVWDDERTERFNIACRFDFMDETKVWTIDGSYWTHYELCPWQDDTIDVRDVYLHPERYEVKYIGFDWVEIGHEDYPSFELDIYEHYIKGDCQIRRKGSDDEYM